MAPELARVRFTFVDLGLTQEARVSRMALATERVVAVNAVAPMTRIRLAVIDVRLARQARVSWRTLARVARD